MWYYSYPPTNRVEHLPFYLISIGRHDLQPQMIKPEGHPHDQFFYNMNGSGCLKMAGVKYELNEGRGFMIPAGVPHEYYPHGEIWDIRWMVPGGYGLGALYDELGIRSGGVFELSDTEPLERILNRMHYELIHDSEYGIQSASGMVYEYILEFCRQNKRAKEAGAGGESSSIYEKHMEVLRDYIEYHFMHKITMEELCGLVHVSPQHLCRIFKRNTGKRPMEYILEMRLANAKRLLSNTAYSVGEISYWSGFENTNYFCRAFQKQEKMTPGEYRLHSSSV